MNQAVSILEKQGVSKEDIQKGLSVPVFFHKPFLTIKTPEGSRGVFFMTYKDAIYIRYGIIDSRFKNSDDETRFACPEANFGLLRCFHQIYLSKQDNRDQ